MIEFKRDGEYLEIRMTGKDALFAGIYLVGVVLAVWWLVVFRWSGVG